MKYKYECPRCGYDTNDKTKMFRHLYENKKTCPGCINNIVLTDEVKQYILDNKRYKYIDPIKEHKSTQYVINILNKMDISQKCTFVEGLKFTDLYDMVERRNEKLVTQFENNMCMDIDIPTLIKNSIHKGYNIFYKNKLYCSFDGSTIETISESIVSYVMTVLIDTTLYAFECALIRQGSMHILTQYYEFLVDLDIMPYICDRPNTEILYARNTDNFNKDSSDYDISEKYMKMYKRIKNERKVNRNISKNIETIIVNTCKDNETYINNLLYKDKTLIGKISAI